MLGYRRKTDPMFIYSRIAENSAAPSALGFSYLPLNVIYSSCPAEKYPVKFSCCYPILSRILFLVVSYNGAGSK
jgi:hypothetical protein